MSSQKQAGKVRVRFFLWPSLLISIALTVLLTLIINLIL